MSQAAAAYRLEGRVTFDNLLTLRREGEAAIAAAGDHVVVDLGGLDNGNSAAVALLMAWYRAADERDKTIEFAAPPEELENIIELSGLDEVLPLSGGHQQPLPTAASRLRGDS